MMSFLKLSWPRREYTAPGHLIIPGPDPRPKVIYWVKCSDYDMQYYYDQARRDRVALDLANKIGMVSTGTVEVR